MALEKRVGVATTRRTLSFVDFVYRAIRICAYILAHWFLSWCVDIADVTEILIVKIETGKGAFFDWIVVGFCAYHILVRFIFFYAFLYATCRFLGDLTHFLLSPAFNPKTLELVSGDEELGDKWKRASLFKRLHNLEVVTDCLMPDGPGCTICQFTSQEVWR